MADINIDAGAVSLTRRGMRAMVFTTNMIGYFFFIDGDSDLYYTKTTDGGLTWGTPVAVSGADTMTAFDVWYDQWTPGDTGRCIHIWHFGITTTDDVNYHRLNTTNDSLTGPVTVFAGSTAVAGRQAHVSGTKARGGNLYCVFTIDAFAETGFYRSLDNGATWGSRTSPLEATGDQAMLFPANLADSEDIWAIYDDISTDQLSIKTHDDSANTWAESSTLSFVENTTDLTGQYGFSGSIRHQDGDLIFAYMDTYDAAGGSTTDLKVYEYDGTNLTALTDIATNVDHIYYPSVFLNQDQPDWIYVANLGVSAGTSTLTTSIPIVYALSKDRGVSWTKDITYSESTTDYVCTWAPLNGEKFMVATQDISSAAIVTNYVNSKDFGYTTFNNYQFFRAKGQDNTGIVNTGGA